MTACFFDASNRKPPKSPLRLAIEALAPGDVLHVTGSNNHAVNMMVVDCRRDHSDANGKWHGCLKQYKGEIFVIRLPYKTEGE